jgi:hypothetical protein
MLDFPGIFISVSPDSGTIPTMGSRQCCDRTASHGTRKDKTYSSTYACFRMCRNICPLRNGAHNHWLCFLSGLRKCLEGKADTHSNSATRSSPRTYQADRAHCTFLISAQSRYRICLWDKLHSRPVAAHCACWHVFLTPCYCSDCLRGKYCHLRPYQTEGSRQVCTSLLDKTRWEYVHYMF